MKNQGQVLGVILKIAEHKSLASIKAVCRSWGMMTGGNAEDGFHDTSDCCSYQQLFAGIHFPFIAGSEDYRSKFTGKCFMDLVCPEKCRCEGTIVDCSNQKLTRLPTHLPEYTTDL